MSLLLVPDVPIDDYWVRWDPDTHEWEFSTDKGVVWRILAENPQVQTLIGLGGSLVKSPEAGKGMIYFDGTSWKIYEGLTGPTSLIPVADPVYFERGGTGYNIAGFSAISFPLWIAPYTCRATRIRAYISDGTLMTVNARKNRSLSLLATDLTVESTLKWRDTTNLQNNTFRVGDMLESQIISVSGTITIMAIIIEFVRT